MEYQYIIILVVGAAAVIGFVCVMRFFESKLHGKESEDQKDQKDDPDKK